MQGRQRVRCLQLAISADYILSFEHPIGRFKAFFFAGLGFTADNWKVLYAEVKRLALECEAEMAQRTPYRQKYIVRGRLAGTEGRTADVVSVWIIREEEHRPRLVTVYPED